MEPEVSRPVLIGTLGVGSLAIAIWCSASPAPRTHAGKKSSKIVLASTKAAEETKPGDTDSPKAPGDAGFERYRSLLNHNPFVPKLPPKPLSELKAPGITPPSLPGTGAAPEVKKTDIKVPPAVPAGPPD